MSLNLGELVAMIGLEDGPFAKGLADNLGKFKEHGGKLGKLAAGIGAAAGVALGGALLGAMDQQNVGAKVAAQLGGTSQDSARYGKLAGDIYAGNFGDSVGQVGEAIASIQQNHLVDANANNADIQSVTQKALTMTSVFGQDMPRVTQAVSQMLRTGLAKSAGEAFDILARGMQDGTNKADDLLDTFNEYPVQFQQLGLSGTQAMGLLSQAVKAGARDSDVAADALKEFAIRAVDGSKTTSDGFKALGLNATKMSADIAAGGPRAAAALDLTMDKMRGIKDPAMQAQIAVGLFGTQSEDMKKALFGMDPSSAVAAMGEVAGATDKAGKTMSDTASGNIETFKRKVQTALVEKVSEAIPNLEKLGKFAGDHTTTLMTLGTVLGGVAVAVWAVNAASTAYKATQNALQLLHVKDAVLWTARTASVVAHGIAVGATAVATGIVTAAQWLWNIAMMANPIGLIILAVVAVIAIFVVLWVKFAGFRDFWKATWEVIKTAALAVWDFLVAAFKIWWATFSGFWTGVGKFFVGLWDGIVSGVKSAWKWITETFDKVVGFVTGLPGRIGQAASGMWNGIKESFRSAINWLIGKWNDFHLTLGGGTIMGVHIPSITLDTPNIPMLKDGGVVPATPGGRMVGVAEGGEDEAVIPLSKLAAMMGGGTTRVVFETGGDAVLDALFRVTRYKVQSDYDGDVNQAFAGR